MLLSILVNIFVNCASVCLFIEVITTQTNFRQFKKFEPSPQFQRKNCELLVKCAICKHVLTWKINLITFIFRWQSNLASLRPCFKWYIRGGFLKAICCFANYCVCGCLILYVACSASQKRHDTVDFYTGYQRYQSCKELRKYARSRTGR